jgi:DNA-binding MarR family transcriptional regulator
MYIHLFGMAKKSLPELPCLCATLRRTSRAVTQAYARAMRLPDMRATQFTILQTLALAGEVTQGRLGAILAMDSTTLTRTLAIMRREKLVAERRGTDRRQRLLRLSKGGKKALAEATPAWERTQQRLRRKLGDRKWQSFMRLTNQLTQLAEEE